MKRRRIIRTLLILCMVFIILPSSALAADGAGGIKDITLTDSGASSKNEEALEESKAEESNVAKIISTLLIFCTAFIVLPSLALAADGANGIKDILLTDSGAPSKNEEALEASKVEAEENNTTTKN